MVHRKEAHSQSNMFKCRDFKNGACRFSSSECWYKHEENQTDDNQGAFQKSDFQKGQENPQPPEVIERILSMMEKLMEKVNTLEKCMKKDQ